MGRGQLTEARHDHHAGLGRARHARPGQRAAVRDVPVTHGEDVEPGAPQRLAPPHSLLVCVTGGDYTWTFRASSRQVAEAYAACMLGYSKTWASGTLWLVEDGE